MLCHCSTHPITGRRKIVDRIVVVGRFTTERHSRDYCARTTYGAQTCISASGWAAHGHARSVRFERIDR
jgi:hypothetical protein